MKSPANYLFKKFLPARLWQQFFLFLLVIVVLPVVILWSLMLNESQLGIRNSVLRDYKEIAIRAGAEVEATIKSAERSLETAAALIGTIHADPWRVETAIVELSLKYPIFQRVSLVGVSGVEVATSRLGSPHKNYSSDDAFQSAVKGEKKISNVYISPEYVPLMTMAFPVRERGQVVGVLLSEINLRGIWSIIDSIQVGENGFAYLVDQMGSIIAHPDKKLVLKNSKALHTNIITDGFQKKFGSRENVNGFVVAFAGLPSLKWTLFVEQPQHEAFSFLNQL